MPGTAQVILAVEDDEVVIPETLELDRGADAAEARAYDDGVERVRVHKLLRAVLTGSAYTQETFTNLTEF